MNEVTKGLQIPTGNRRSFVRNLGLAGAAAGIVGSSQLEAQSVSLTDVDILNFALNLEYLEAEFYTMATSGAYIDAFGVTISGSGTAGATTGGQQVPFSTTNSTIRRMALDLADEERYHVSLLQNTIVSLGGTPIAKPQINLTALGASFFTSETNFLILARIFEEIGVTAYGGAAPLLTSKAVLGYAARILATEAEHVGYIRALINEYAVAVTTPLDSVDVLPPPSGTASFSTNTMAITGIRTPAEVLFLAYATASASSGGFFPVGVNGNANLKTSSAGASVSDAATFTITPNPVVASGGLGTVTLAWSCPSTVQYVEIRVHYPAGPIFADAIGVGTAMTGQWVTDGMIFYLQDMTYPKNLNPTSANNTIATAIARLQGVP